MKYLALCTLRIKSGCTKFAPIKGQLISKCLFGIIVFTKKPTKVFFKGISALVSLKEVKSILTRGITKVLIQPISRGRLGRNSENILLLFLF